MATTPVAPSATPAPPAASPVRLLPCALNAAVPSVCRPASASRAVPSPQHPSARYASSVPATSISAKPAMPSSARPVCLATSCTLLPPPQVPSACCSAPMVTWPASLTPANSAKRGVVDAAQTAVTAPNARAAIVCTLAAACLPAPPS